MNRLFLTGMMAAFLLCGTGIADLSVSKATAAEETQAAPAQAAVVKNKKGEVIKVYSFADGGVTAVMPDGTVLSGADAIDALAAEGLTVTVAPDGSMQVAGDPAAVITAPRPATPAEAAAARAAVSPVSAAPAGIASDGGRMSMESFNTSMGASGMPGILAGKSASK